MNNYAFTPPSPDLVEDWIELSKPVPRHPLDPGVFAALAAEWGYQQCLKQHEHDAMALVWPPLKSIQQNND